MNRTCITASLLLLLLGGVLPAQTLGVLTGQVTDTAGAPIRGATIVVLGMSPPRGALSKHDGKFICAGLRKGTYDIVVAAVAYEKDTIRNVRIEPDSSTTVNVRLKLMPGGRTISLPRCGPSVDTIGYKMLRSARPNVRDKVVPSP